MRVDRIVEEAAAAQGVADKAALIEDGQPPVSYAQLERRIAAAACALQGEGVAPGQRVVLVGENSADMVVLVFAAMRAGAWAVPLNARMAGGEIDAICAHCRPRLAYFATASAPEAAAHAARIGAHECAQEGLRQGRVALFTDGVESDGSDDGSDRDVAAMIYTSGSTGTPKGVMLTHANLDFVTRTSMQQQVVLPEDIVFHALPISHSFGLVSALMCGLRAGATLHLVARFSAEKLAHAIVHTGITVFQGVPAMYARLHEWALRSGSALQPNRLRLTYIGGSLVDAARKAQTETLLGLRLHHGYGLTEAAPAATRTIGHPPPSDVTAGWPIPGIEVVLRDAHGEPVPPGEHGEVWIRGPNVMKGYFRDPEQTRSTLDDEGWLHTGDIGEFGRDGDLAIVGRLKEMIIRGGFNVYPAEVERAIAAYPGVAQCAVVGRTVPGNEEIVAFVEPLAGWHIEVDGLRRFLRERLAPYKLPSEVVCMEHLPAAATGKLLKAQLKTMAGAAAAKVAG
ncbi:class I adenylate-forming enzyme family protein [Piscinibacter sp.]|uniref:class I adenylate-forming enzyme family protein n=1 Tax=Piscinibacter sp. TaxID=1903157 RepID=UPI002C0A1FFD|nr:AMP-binding protein [Albitalea sp.]HUG21838.1 AMP-binding protein [Albitalea sp.]